MVAKSKRAPTGRSRPLKLKHKHLQHQQAQSSYNNPTALSTKPAWLNAVLRSAAKVREPALKERLATALAVASERRRP
jgi:hypothetical protein